MSDRRFDISCTASFFALYLSIFLVVFFGLHQQPRQDLIFYYVPEAHAVIKGLVPYRDFPSSYAPLNPYLDALILRVDDSPLSIIVFQIACGVASVPFWIGFLRRYLTEEVVRRAALLYLVQPLVLWETCIDGKNQACISLLLAVAFLTIGRREFVSGVSYGLSLVLVKILPIIFLPVLLIGHGRRLSAWLLGALALPIIVYAEFLLRGADVTVAVRQESSYISADNLPYFLVGLIGHSIPARMSDGILAIAYGCAALVASSALARSRNERERLSILAMSVVFILLTILALSKKSFDSYLGMTFFLMCANVALSAQTKRMSAVYVYVLLSFLVLPVNAFWFYPLNAATALQVHELCASGSGVGLTMMLSLALLLFTYIWFAVRILNELRGTRAPEWIQSG